jgi:hypothetical protein
MCKWHFDVRWFTTISIWVLREGESVCVRAHERVCAGACVVYGVYFPTAVDRAAAGSGEVLVVMALVLAWDG